MKVLLLKSVENIATKGEIASFDVYKSRLLQRPKKASVCGKGLAAKGS